MMVDCDVLEPLTAAERCDLLWLARSSIEAALRGREQPRVARLSPKLSEPGAAFVSLHRQGQLRGCIGTIAADRPLHETVASMARSAALEDPRFAPVASDELAELVIEISRLGALRPAAADEIRLGQHGVCLEHHGHRALFLPQVATLGLWDRDTFLSELCAKACLPADAWKHADARLCIFVAEVFSEESEACRRP